MRYPGRTRILAMAAIAFAPACRAQDAADSAPSPVEAIAARLTPELGAAARQWLHGDDRELRALVALSPASLEQAVVVALASAPPAADFVLDRLAREPADTDRLVLKVIAYDEFWVEEPRAAAALQHLAESTPDPDLMLAFLDAERRLEDKRLHRILSERLASAKRSGDARALAELADADERWILIERGATVPAYLRRVPAVFAVKPADRPIRVVGIGDFGTGSQAQRDVAAAMVKTGRQKPFDFGLTLGDNFYPSGMASPEDPRWRDWWENLYGPLGIVFYASLGNHDWYSDDGAVAEIEYKSPTWRLPAPYYSFTAGPVQFFAVDTTDISEAQARWLDGAIAASTARWKIVFGHHPIFAPERNAQAGAYMEYTRAHLWPVIRGRVDAYLCGHQHAMALMEPRDGVHFFMSGGGGAPLVKVAAKAPGAVFAQSNFGFLTLEADRDRVTVTLFDKDAKPYTSEVLTK